MVDRFDLESSSVQSSPKGSKPPGKVKIQGRCRAKEKLSGIRKMKRKGDVNDAGPGTRKAKILDRASRKREALRNNDREDEATGTENDLTGTENNNREITDPLKGTWSEEEEKIEIETGIPSPHPGAWAVSGTGNQEIPQDTPNSNELNRQHLAPPIPDQQEDAADADLVHATLVEEPPLVVAMAAPDDNEKSSMIESMVKQAIGKERTRLKRFYIRLAVGIAVILMLVVGVVIGVVVALQGEDSDASKADLQPEAKYEEPVALCQSRPVEVAVGVTCEVSSILPYLVDSGSSGDDIKLSVYPPGPYSLGQHNVTLFVEDSRGKTDSCSSILVVVDPLTPEWTLFGSKAYRARGVCMKNWFEAEEITRQTALCGGQAHLATITSSDESMAVQQLVEKLEAEFGRSLYWIGGSQPSDAQEPDENWTWITGEGRLDETYSNWDDGEPNRNNENCLAILMSNRGYHWDDRDCMRRYRYIEEVDLYQNVIIDGCDSGVPDNILDTTSCTFEITPGIVSACGSGRSNTNDFLTCVDTYLTTLVDKDRLMTVQKEAILNCGIGNEPPVALCRDVTINVDYENLAPVAVEVSDFDNGTFDPDGDTLRLELTPPGPFLPGIHTVSLLAFDGRGGRDECQSLLTVDNGNEPPVARCQPLLEASVSGDCSVRKAFIGSDVDDGSSDPEGGPLTFTLDPSGPYSIGLHNVSLTVVDEKGASDTCETTIIIRESAPLATSWVEFQNHAYRIHLCAVDHETARLFSSERSICEAKAHLVTIRSEGERDFVRDLARSLNLGNDEFWLGGFQLPGSPEPAGGWTWENDEGLVFEGYNDWDPGEPNSEREDCMIMLGSNRGYRWDDRPCERPYRYIEEADLEANVVIDGCDTGVRDTLTDVASCSYLIAEGIEKCIIDGNADAAFGSCVNTFLADLVSSGTLTGEERDAITNCAGLR